MKTFIAFMFCVFSLVMLAITSSGAVASIESAVSTAAVVTEAAAVLQAKADLGSIKATTDSGDPDSGIPKWLQIAGLIVGTASTIAAVTPTPKDDGVLFIVRKVVDLLALNFLGAKNAAATKRQNELR